MKRRNLALMAAVTIGLSSAVMLASCTNRDKYIGVEGIVIEKEFEPTHKTTTMIWSGKVAVPYIRTVPDRWSLTVKYETDGKEIEYEVSEETYNTYEVGDVYVYTGEEVK